MRQNASELLGCILLFTITIDCEPCKESASTIQVVRRCPEKDKEISEFSRKCEEESHRQKCTSPSQYSYHCVFNMHRTLLMTVCAPRIKSEGGHCVAFDYSNLRLVTLNDTDCTQDDPVSCPPNFWSIESYKYISCTKTSKEEPEEKISTISPDSENEIPLKILILTIISLVTVLMTLLAISIRHKVKNTKCPGKEARKQRKRKLGSIEETSRLEEGFIKEARERRKRKLRSVEETSRLEEELTKGYDTSIFEYFLKRHNLGNCVENLRKGKIECLQTFLELDEGKLEKLGLKYGEVRKCLMAIVEAKKKPQEESLTSYTYMI